MKRAIFVLAAGLALVGRPAPAMAKNVIRCMLEAVEECDARFPPGDYRNIAIRGWCYMISTGICAAS
jgi:hypothetical protein